MSSTEFARDTGDEYVTEKVHTDTQTAEIRGHIPARHLRLSLADGQVVNDGQDTETVAVSVVSGLQVARGNTPADVLDEDGTATVDIDGQPVEVDLTGGTGQREVTTTAAAGTTISVEAVGLADHPAESDTAEIEVIQA